MGGLRCALELPTCTATRKGLVDAIDAIWVIKFTPQNLLKSHCFWFVYSLFPQTCDTFVWALHYPKILSLIAFTETPVSTRSTRINFPATFINSAGLFYIFFRATFLSQKLVDVLFTTPRVLANKNIYLYNTLNHKHETHSKERQIPQSLEEHLSRV